MAKKICKECLTEFDGRMKYCPSCGAPASEAMDIVEEPQAAAPTAQPSVGSDAEHDPDDDLRLGKGMKVFIVVGLLLLACIGIFQYMAHRNDPEYTRTLIDPDSTLADRDLLILDTTSVDTAEAKKAEQEERKEAERVYNNIRRHAEPQAEDIVPQGEEGEGGEAPSAGEPSASPEPKSEPAPAPAQPAAPKVEAIE